MRPSSSNEDGHYNHTELVRALETIRATNPLCAHVFSQMAERSPGRDVFGLYVTRNVRHSHDRPAVLIQAEAAPSGSVLTLLFAEWLLSERDSRASSILDALVVVLLPEASLSFRAAVYGQTVQYSMSITLSGNDAIGLVSYPDEKTWDVAMPAAFETSHCRRPALRSSS